MTAIAIDDTMSRTKKASKHTSAHAITHVHTHEGTQLSAQQPHMHVEPTHNHKHKLPYYMGETCEPT
jgi:hypothetical protein